MGQADEKAIILGGSGLVGFQVARKLASRRQVRTIAIHARYRGETEDALEKLRREFPGTEFRGTHGDLFLPGEPTPAGEEGTPQPDRRDPALRRRLFDDTYGRFEFAFRDSLLAKLILREQPDVVVDSVNTATAISYQDVYTACHAVRSGLDAGGKVESDFRDDVEKLLASLSIPQLILHARILNRAMTEAGVRIYLKIGTTGTGGMGLNIPYTHGEERPSPQLLNKTAVAFAHTGMLFLMARTPGSPIIKELKPAALIGYRGVEHRTALGRQFRKVEREGGTIYEPGPRNEPYLLYRPRAVELGGELDLTPDPAGYEKLQTPGGSGHLEVPLVDTGENGLFTLGEFEAITALDQMEYITPEEIADLAVMEIKGVGTGTDVVSAIDSTILGSTYKAGLLRPAALEKLARLEERYGVPSIALGRLGPPGLAKHLFEAYLFRRRYGSLASVLALSDGADPGEKVSRELFELLETDPLLASLSTSIGIPILCPNGRTLLRGPVISAPPYRSFRSRVPVDGERLEEYAATWVDLRPARMTWWLDVFDKMHESRFSREGGGWATERVDRASYLSDAIEIGNVVAWIFSNRGVGYRVL